MPSVTLRPRSLSARIVALVLLLLAVAATVIAVVTTVRLSHSLSTRLDDDVRGALRFGLRPPPLPGAPVLGLRFQEPDMLTAVFRDGQVTAAWIVTRDGQQVGVPTTAYPELLATPVGDRPSSAALGDLGDYRLLGAPAPDGAVVVVGLPEGRVQDTVATLVTIEVVVTVAALLGAGAAGLYLVRRELRPLQRVAAIATRVSTLPLAHGEVELAERVPDVDPETEVGQVGAALNRMLDHVGDALAARQASETRLRRFVADASHELRTPLTAIRGYAELAQRADNTERSLPERADDTQLGPDAAYALARISSQTERMTTLVEDLLLLARLDAGRPLERGPVDLTRLVLDAVNDAHVAGPDHRWALDLPAEPVVVSGDASRLAQVLANLLANARTHTPAGTVVTVALAEAGDVALTIRDDGPGIAPDLLPHVFERFARGSASRSRRHGSTGLGLAIVDAVIAAHGGRVQVASRPGSTEFRVTLPAP